LSLAASLAFGWSASAEVVRSSGSGDWSAPKTWEAGKVPAAGDTALVREGHAIVYDIKSTATLRALFIAGTVSFAPDRDTEMNVGLIKIQHTEKLEENGFDGEPHPADAKPKPATGQPGFTAGCLCCDGKPALLVGTPEIPIAKGKTAIIRLHYVDGMDRESCPAIVCHGGRMDFHGQSMNRTWVKLGASTKTVATEILLAEPVSGWNVGDQVIVTSSEGYRDEGRAFEGKAEQRAIAAIDGDRITLDQPLSRPRVGVGEFRAEVANLSRNVVVESAKPDGERGHVMYHRGSAGGVSYAEFRHLGKQGVLGRYNLHYHQCGDTMRGSSIVGASFHHSKNRFLTVHGTNYLVVRDCVGFHSVGHGFFLEDGTEVYNLFDRNLACQALEGRPLPKQLLPFDPNDGAGFWFANAHNMFTRNVAVECRQYGFRYEATPKAGLVSTDGAPKRDFAFGDGKKPFDLVMNVRQPDGQRQPTDIRSLPLIRFDDNETHSNGFWGMNMGLGSAGVGPDASNPHVIRNLKIWGVIGGFGIESPRVLIDGMTIHEATYGVRGSAFTAQDWRRVSINSRNRTIASPEDYAKGPSSRHRQPGWTPRGTGDGGARSQAPEIEAVRLEPIDALPPITVMTDLRAEGGSLVIQGTASDNGAIKRVTVNGVEASVRPGGEWKATLPQPKAGALKVTALAEDAAGNVERTPHEIMIVVR
jgi:hypothetical protein